MKVRTFRHGIHPPENKETTNKKAIETIYPLEGELMLYPLSQHIGAPCEPLVKSGDKVLMGQKIGDSEAAVSAPVHSSVSGVVKEIRPTVTPSGATSNAIVVESDGRQEEHESLKTRENYLELSKSEYLKIIREAGIVGLGGAGFPTHIKLNPPPEKKIDVVIVNASECEPYLTTDHRVLLEESFRIKSGLMVILRMFPEARGIIAVETNKRDAIAQMLKECADDGRIEIVPLKPKYPQGSEKQLIYACTGREVPSGGLPMDAGCIVDNVDTVIAIDRAARRGRPIMRKVVTLAGGAVKTPGNYKALLGMTYKSLVERTGGFTEEPYKLISGGPMMGAALFDLNIPIVKTSSALLCLTKNEAELPDESACIRCGKCVGHCPIGLMPLELNKYALRGEIDIFLKNHGTDCIECGSCTYVCPAKRHLVQSIKAMKRQAAAVKK